MALELGTFEVTDVVLGSETAYRDGLLTIDPAEIRARVLQNPRFTDVTVDVVKPGERVRIHNVLDAAEPRARVSDPGSDFPGVLRPPKTAGTGRTHRLGGVAVCELAEPVPGEPAYWRQAIFDMSGPGADHSPFGELVNVALTFSPNPDQFSRLDEEEASYDVLSGTADVVAYNDAVRRAGLDVGVHLAATTAELEPPDVQRFDLSVIDRNAGKPRVVYFYQGRPYVYGESIRNGSGGPGELPTLIHPNKVLDGAVINSWAGPASTATSPT